VIEERFPATADRALACLKALNAGVNFERENGIVTGVCGCGHPVATRSFESAYSAMRDHFTRQVEQ
jgi:hypothetical protein